MNNHDVLLEHIANDNTSTQRELSSKMGLSLGAVNRILARCVKNGLIKMEKVNARTVKYILTPKGISQVTKRTYSHLVRAFNYFSDIRNAISDLIKETDQKIILIGKADDVYKMIILTLNELDTDNYIYYKSIEDNKEDGKIVCWNEDVHNELIDKKKDHLFILEKLWKRGD